MQKYEEKIIAGAKLSENAGKQAGTTARTALKSSWVVLIGFALLMILMASGALRGFYVGIRGKK